MGKKWRYEEEWKDGEWNGKNGNKMKSGVEK